MNREEWLKERRTGIGGSDAAAAVGMSKWKTPLELYLDKLGLLETAENEPMFWGNALEPVIRQVYCDRTGRTVVVPPGIIRHPTVNFALMTPDGIADESRVLQVKTARTSDGWGEPGSGDIPQEYLFQTQHEMFVTGLPVADVAVLIGGSDFRIYVVERDAEFQALLIDQERAFWQRVLTENPPEPANAADVKRRWKIASGGRSEADDTIAAAILALMQINERLAVAESNKEELTAMVQAHMKDAAELTAGDTVLATWKNVKASPRFDRDAFQAAHPDIYRQFLVEPQPQRRFLLKVKGIEACQQQLLSGPQPPKLEQAAAE